LQQYYRRYFWFLTAPAVLLFVLVIALPFLTGVLYSFTAWRGTYFAGGKSVFESFVGLENYRATLESVDFRAAFTNSLFFTGISLAAVLVSSLGFALLIGMVRKAAGFYRAVLFLPNLLGGLALGYIWSFLFEIVYTRYLFGGEGALLNVPFFANMLQSRWQALTAMAIVTTWQMAGYMMMIFITGLNNIPGSLYEAADIDGCTAMQRFRHITAPLLLPSFTIVLFLTLANCFKMLDVNVALTEGSFNTRLLAYQILRVTRDFSPPDYGQAQAQAVIFFVLIAGVTLLQVSLTKRREVAL